MTEEPDSSQQSEAEEHHPIEKRPRMEVDVVRTKVKAEAEAITRPVTGEEDPQRKGEITTRVTITINCTCECEVTAYTSQRKVICQGCGREWVLN